MIYANELRIGNFLQYEGDVCPIMWIMDTHLCIIQDWVEDEEEDKFHEDEITKFEAIPITEQWLLDFGFEYHDYYVQDEEDIEDDSDGITHTYKIGGNKIWWYTINLNPSGLIEFCKCGIYHDEIVISWPKSVHQLQNLYFALTGEELERTTSNA